MSPSETASAQENASKQNWRPWQGTEREDFFDAIARHRKAAWRVTAVSVLAYAVLAVVMSLLLAPLLYCIAGLLLDVLNLLAPMPDLLGYAGGLLAPIIDNPGTQSTSYLLRFIILASAPGLLLMVLTGFIVARAIRQSALFDLNQQVGRQPDTRVLAEQRFANTIGEMAVAAMIPSPSVIITAGGANAAAAGHDTQHAHIIVGEELLSTLNRVQMQGVAAHLIASIADNDMKIGERTASLLGMFALITRLALNVMDKEAFANSRKLLRALLIPTAASRKFILEQLADPFSDSPQSSQNTSNTLSWREWLLMPLMGPVVMSGFLGGFVSNMMLSPIVSLAWRQRKYMADAAAVRLTREPDGLFSALTTLQDKNAALLATGWADHVCVVAPSRKGSLIVPIFPSLARRLAALVRMGATQPIPEQPAPNTVDRRWPVSGPMMILLAGLLTLAAILMVALIPLLILVSTMLTGLFTLFPTALLHALLR